MFGRTTQYATLRHLSIILLVLIPSCASPPTFQRPARSSMMPSLSLDGIFPVLKNPTIHALIGIADFPKNNEVVVSTDVGQLFWVNDSTGMMMKVKRMSTGDIDELVDFGRNSAFSGNSGHNLISVATTAAGDDLRGIKTSRSVYLIDASTGAEKARIGISNPAISTTISNNGNLLGIGFHGGGMLIVRISDNHILMNHLALDDLAPTGAMAFTDDLKAFARGVGGALEVWDTRGWTRRYIIPGALDIKAIVPSTDSLRALVGGVNTLRLIDLTSGKVLKDFVLPPDFKNVVYRSVGFINADGIIFGAFQYLDSLEGGIALWSISEKNALCISHPINEPLTGAVFAGSKFYLSGTGTVFVLRLSGAPAK